MRRGRCGRRWQPAARSASPDVRSCDLPRQLLIASICAHFSGRRTMMTNPGRRGFLAGAGLAGAGAVLGTGSAASAAARATRRRPVDGYLWLAGDHHIHSQYSNDAMFPVAAQAERAITNGLDWITITDHGNVAFATYSVGPLVADIVAARKKYHDDLLVFTGLEWNIPGG